MSQQGPLNLFTAGGVVTSITADSPVLANGVSGVPEAGSVTISVNGTVPTSFPADVGTAVPSANALHVIGAGGTTVTGSGNTLTIDSTGAAGVLSLTATAPITVSAPTGNVNIALTTPLAVQYGGTGIATLASGTVPSGAGTSPMVPLAYGSLSVASTLVFRDANSNSYFNNVGVAVASFAIGTIPLTVATPRQIILTASATGVTLPDATTLQAGTEFRINNNTASTAVVNKNGGTLLTNVPSGGFVTVYVTDISTAAGSWDYHFLIPSNTQWGTASLVVPSTTLISAGKYNLTGTSSGTITIQPQANAGTYNFNLPITAGSSGDVLTSGGGGSTAMTWTTPSSSFVTSISATAPITASASTGAVTIALTTPLALNFGGTNANLTASNGGIFYSTGTAAAILSGTATASQILQSGASSAPSWSIATYPSLGTSTGSVLRADGTNWSATTATYPNTTTINQILYSSSNNVIGGITASNNGVLISGTTGIPSWLAAGTTGQYLAATTGSPPSWATLSSAAVTSISGTPNQINVSASTGAVTLSLSSTIITPGTLAINSMTTGSVLYIGASSVVSQDNANFFWDATNHRLGLHNTSPTAFLEVGNSALATSNYLTIHAANAVDKGVAWSSSGSVRAYMILPGGSQEFLQITTGVQNVGIDLVNNTTMIGTGTSLSQLGVNGGVAIGSYSTANAAPSNGAIISGNLYVGTPTNSFSNVQFLLQGSSTTQIGIYANATSTVAREWYLNNSNSFGAGIDTDNTYGLYNNINAITRIWAVGSAGGLSIGFGSTAAPSAGLIVTGQSAIGTSSVNASTQFEVSATSAYGTYITGTQTSVDGSSNQGSIYLLPTLNPTNGSTISAGIYSAPVITCPNAKTITVGCGMTVNTDTSGNVGVISSLIGLYLQSGSSTAAGTISSAYNLYVNQPLPSSTSGNYYATSIQGGQVWHRTSTATDETETTAKTIVAVTSTAAARTITLPSTPPDTGWIIIIKDESGGAATHNITVSGNGHNIDGAATAVINTNYGVLRIYSNQTQYYTW